MQVGIKVIKLRKSGDFSHKGKLITTDGLNFITGDTLTATLQVKHTTDNAVETHNYTVQDMPAFHVLQLLKGVVALGRICSNTFTVTINGNTLLRGANYSDYLDVLPNAAVYFNALTKKV